MLSLDAEVHSYAAALRYEKEFYFGIAPIRLKRLCVRMCVCVCVCVCCVCVCVVRVFFNAHLLPQVHKTVCR